MESVVLHRLSIGYSAKGCRKVVATGLQGCVRSGELTCLLGRNGIGKSTLLRTLSGFQSPLSGEVLMAVPSSPDAAPCLPLSALGDRQRSRLIGVVLTEKPDVAGMTVEELVAMGRSPYTGFWGTLHDDDRRLVGEAVRLAGIGPLRGRMVQTLSDGERQKVMIAKVLAQQTPIIYLDEPTAFLDFPSKVDTMQLLRRLAREEQKTVLLSTHDVELALRLADRVWLMEPGRLSVGTPHELAADGTLARFIECPGIAFDRRTMAIRVEKNGYSLD